MLLVLRHAVAPFHLRRPLAPAPCVSPPALQISWPYEMLVRRDNGAEITEMLVRSGANNRNAEIENNNRICEGSIRHVPRSMSTAWNGSTTCGSAGRPFSAQLAGGIGAPAACSKPASVGPCCEAAAACCCIRHGGCSPVIVTAPTWWSSGGGGKQCWCCTGGNKRSCSCCCG